MIPEEKQILLKDLTARLPYGVKVCTSEFLDSIEEYHPNEILTLSNLDYYIKESIEVKPYLRPMSSITEEEIEEYRSLSDEVIGSYGPYHHEFIAHCVRLGIKPNNPHECVDDFLNMEAIDWLLEHHFDFRGLIEKGLALEAPEGMYETE